MLRKKFTLFIAIPFSSPRFFRRSIFSPGFPRRSNFPALAYPQLVFWLVFAIMLKLACYRLSENSCDAVWLQYISWDVGWMP